MGRVRVRVFFLESECTYRRDESNDLSIVVKVLPRSRNLMPSSEDELSPDRDESPWPPSNRIESIPFRA